MADDHIERVPITDLREEEGAEELANSAQMEPYVHLAVALMKGAEPTEELEIIRGLPLEKRYVWRIASALKWGFGDFDNLGVTADRDTLPETDFARLRDLLKLRPLQFCLFLKALLGPVEMQRMMVEAIKTAKQIP